MATPPLRIGLYTPDYSDYVHRLVDGVLRFQAEHPACRIHDFRFHFGDLNRLPPAPPWTGRGIDGIMTFVGPQPGLGDWLRSGGVPVVNTTADRSEANLPSVHSSFRSIARLATEHLVERGFTHFAFVGYVESPGAAAREWELSAELGRRGWHLDSCRIPRPLEGNPHDVGILLGDDDCLRAFLAQAPKPLAVCTESDSYAAAVSQVCRRGRWRIPEDVAILSVDDSSIARLNDPPLSSIRIPGEEIGYRAAVLLDSLVRGAPPPAEPIQVDATEVVARESTCRDLVRDADVARALLTIRSCACAGLRVGDLLATLHLSRKTFEQRFLAEIGRTPGEEIRRVRLERACELLATTDLSITRISRMIGYERSSVFTEFFKRATGRTPRDYRAERALPQRDGTGGPGHCFRRAP